jgi:uncharacterized protein DUF5916/cellulose/xylan binding protein with CBM9 domain
MASYVRRAAALFAALPVALVAQSTEPARHSFDAAHVIPVPAATAVRRTGPIALDGKLDEEAWKAATPVTEFTQTDPDEGKPASQKTEMRFLFDGDALYIGARMYDTEGAAGVHTSLVRRDQTFNSDYIEIVIDGYHDHLGRAFFDINPSGSIQDQLGIGASCCDTGWDPVWQVATSIDSLGWTAEMRIPLNQLRFSKDSVQTWGLQLRRFIHRRQETDQWAFWLKTETSGASRFGHLTGLELKSEDHHLELLPYVVGKSSNTAFTPGDPFNNGHKQSANAGLDLRYSVSSNLTLDATFNPDFGQVELDPAVINLSAYEIQFPEKRPFFVSGSTVFNFGGFNCYFCSNVSSLNAFYSRRIGRAPTGADLAANSPYSDVPDADAILGAAKITGRTSNGYTIGILDAVTNRESAPVQLSNGVRASQEVDPLANYFVARVKKDMLGGNLVLGGIVTSVVRNTDTTFAPRLNRHAELIGSDFLYTWSNHVYSLQGQYALSSIEGDSRDISAIEQSSAHYFQRPDRGRGSNGFLTDRFDTTATSMRGLAGYTRLGKDSGDWLWELNMNLTTPGFEDNDLGFETRSDYFFYGGNIFRTWTKPTSWYRQFNVIFGGQTKRNFEGDLIDRQLQLYFGSTTLNFWQWDAFYIWRPSVMDDALLRGGPVVRRPGVRYVEADVNTDSRHLVTWSAGANYAATGAGGWGTNFSASALIRPTSSVSITLGPSWNDSRTAFQYVGTFADPTATAFYGSRYVVSAIKQKQIEFDTRLSVTFTPRTTLELYVQPFIASGHYLQFEEFNAPRQGSVSVYGVNRGTITAATDANGVPTTYTVDPDGPGPAQPFTFTNPDFNFRSLRGTAVFRWEYHPGSTLYIAWTHSRSDTQPYGDFDFSRDEQGLLATRPDNIFIIKASWWIGGLHL